MDKAIITTSWDDGHPVVLKLTKLQTLKALEELCRVYYSECRPHQSFENKAPAYPHFALFF